MHKAQNITEILDKKITVTNRRFLVLEDVKHTIWLTRPDIQKMVKEDRDQFELWLIINGTREYKALAELNPDLSIGFFTEEAEEALPEATHKLTRFMKAIWNFRVDLHSEFDLSDIDGQNAYIRWFFTVGVRELSLQKYITEAQLNELNEPILKYSESSLLPVTRIMKDVWENRPDLQQAFNLDVSSERDAFVAWYFTHGMSELDLIYTIDLAQAQALLTLVGDGVPVSLVHMFLWSANAELQTRFPDSQSIALSDWLKEKRQDYPILDRVFALIEDNTGMSDYDEISLSELKFGVNLVGYAKGQFGIGEDVRMAALALESAGIPFTIYNVEPGREVCQGDESAVKHISDALPYSINIFCTTGIETARLAAVYGSKLFDGRYSIGYWPWELPEWPTEWHHAYNLVDEVWASSQFVHDAYAKSSPKPVRQMPMAVDVEPTAHLTRRDFQLPEGRFLFVFSFDFLSSLARKNPQACIEAFQKAFPIGDEPVGLVLKAMRATDRDPLWQEILEKVIYDSRIVIISETLERSALLDLYRVCDCYLSLHRSEGFGRSMVEAMMLGRPVVATSFSGNIDYMKTNNSYLVEYDLRTLQDNEYAFGDSQVWAEPKIDNAVNQIKAVFAESNERQKVAQSGKTFACQNYTIQTIGSLYMLTLTELKNETYV